MFLLQQQKSRYFVTVQISLLGHRTDETVHMIHASYSLLMNVPYHKKEIFAINLKKILFFLRFFNTKVYTQSFFAQAKANAPGPI